MKETVTLGKITLKKNEDSNHFLGPVAEPYRSEVRTLIYPDTGEERRYYFEFHPRDDEWAGDTAKRFNEMYVKRYNAYLSGDDHKMDTSMSIPEDIYGFSYTLAKDYDTDAIIGFYAKRCSPKIYKGKQAVCLDGHSMFSIPGLDTKDSGIKKEIISRGDDDNHFVMSNILRDTDIDMKNATPKGMGGRGAKDKEKNSGLATMISLFDWNEAIKWYDHPMLYSLDVANEASGYILTHKFDRIPFKGQNWKELSWRTNKKNQRCMIRIERLFHPENW